MTRADAEEGDFGRGSARCGSLDVVREDHWCESTRRLTAMRFYMRLPLAALFATLLLCTATGTAVALRSLEFNPAGALTRVNTGIRLTSGTDRIEFDETLRGTWNSRIPKTIGAVLGRITSVTTANCRVLEPPGFTCTATAVGVEAGTPITKTYRGFSGTLPNITSIRIREPNIDYEIDFIAAGIRIVCRYEGSREMTSSGNPITRDTIAASELRLISRESMCPREVARFEGTYSDETRNAINLL
jgi:hypothetical protein